MDRHKIWRIVHNNLEGLRQDAPEGYEPVVEVFLVGRAEPVRLAQVQTTREEAFPWALLVADMGSDVVSDQRLVFVPHKRYIERIEIGFVRSEGRQVGFSYRELEDSAPSNDE